MIPIVEKEGCIYFLIEWVGDSFEFSADFIVHEVTAWHIDYSIADTEPYLLGMAKWDGNLHLYFTDNDGYVPIFGKEALDNHTLMLKAIWEHCSMKIEKWDNDLAKA